MQKPRIYTPDTLVSESTVIVTTNHFGASMETPDGHPNGDSGRDAQALADISGQRVIGFDRPHSGNGQRFSAVQMHMMKEQPAIIFKSWLDRVQPAVNETGASRIELVGKSIAASFLMEVALLEELPVAGLVAVDPLTMQTSSRAALISRFRKEVFHRDTSSLRRHFLELRQNRGDTLSDKAHMTAALIAARMITTKALLTFADVRKPQERAQLTDTMESISNLRSKRNGVAPLLADFASGTSHRSFNQPEVYVAQYQRYRALGRTGDVFTQKIETVQTNLL